MNNAFWEHTIEILLMLGVAFLLGLLLGYLLWARKCAQYKAGMQAKVTPDDLKKIEGIGPKTEKLCNGVGIYTWQQLANTSVDDLRKMLRDAGPDYRVTNPATWPRQAALAAAGKWDELGVYQQHLIAGREPG